MEPVGGAGPAGGGGPAPFLQKTYDMVDDSSTDDIVSWSTTMASFVVWNPPEFAARLLPAYFKHNNFSSFIRQLNTYGFRKIDPERWEFANEDFIKDQKHLLKNIHRRKPIHSHSHPVDSLPDSERTALEEEIEGLSREKAGLHADLWLFKQQQSGTKIQLEDIERRLYDMEQRQAKMIAFLKKAVQNPKFVENLIKMAGAGASSVIHKKRRLPGVDYRSDVTENSFYDNHSSLSKQDVGQVFNPDFCDKLKLGLCPAAISDGNLVTASTQSSNGERGNPQGEQNNGGNGRMECLSFVPETTELLDTGTSFCSRKDALFPGTVDDGDGLISCHLNLSLASSSMQIDEGLSLSRTPNSVTEEANANKEENLHRIVVTNQSTAPDSAEGNAPPLQEAMQTSNQGPQAAPGRVNDVFWEQFLTERPGSSDTEDASSSLRANLCDVQPEERNTENEGMWKTEKIWSN